MNLMLSEHYSQRSRLGEELEFETHQPKLELKIKKKSKSSITTVCQFFAKPMLQAVYV